MTDIEDAPVVVNDPQSGAAVAFRYRPRPPQRGQPDGQTDGCYCRVCRDPDNGTDVCIHADSDQMLLCQSCEMQAECSGGDC